MLLVAPESVEISCRNCVVAVHEPSVSSAGVKEVTKDVKHNPYRLRRNAFLLLALVKLYEEIEKLLRKRRYHNRGSFQTRGCPRLKTSLRT